MRTEKRKSSALFDLLRILLVPVSLVVAAALLLVALPQSASDRIVWELQSRTEGFSRQKIALLGLGHQTEGNRLHIWGIVRNISTAPIDQLDAIVSLYASNRDLLETVIVRMDKETLEPNEIGRFELVYPNSGSEFSSYSVEFKLRRGEIVPHKDMRNPIQATSAPPGE